MPLQPLSLESLRKCGLATATAAVAWDVELARAVKDLADRGAGDDSVRTVVLELRLTPNKDQHGGCSSALGQFRIYSKLPKQQTEVASFQLETEHGRLMARPGSEENVNQLNFDDRETQDKEKTQ